MHYGGRALVRALELDDHGLPVVGEDSKRDVSNSSPPAFDSEGKNRDTLTQRERNKTENRKHEVKVLLRDSTAWRPCATR